MFFSFSNCPLFLIKCKTLAKIGMHASNFLINSVPCLFDEILFNVICLVKHSFVNMQRIPWLLSIFLPFSSLSLSVRIDSIWNWQLSWTFAQQGVRQTWRIPLHHSWESDPHTAAKGPALVGEALPWWEWSTQYPKIWFKNLKVKEEEEEHLFQ